MKKNIYLSLLFVCLTTTGQTQHIKSSIGQTVFDEQTNGYYNIELRTDKVKEILYWSKDKESYQLIGYNKG